MRRGELLWQTGLRFLLFDGLGLVGMGIAFLLLRPTGAPAASAA